MPPGKPRGMNPKDVLGQKKAPLRLVPPALVIGASEAMADGARKYGAYNWRPLSILYSVYLEAIYRHLLDLIDGEDLSGDSQIHHMKHIAANAAIVLDALALGILVDDRPAKGPASALLAQWSGSLREERKRHEGVRRSRDRKVQG